MPARQVLAVEQRPPPFSRVQVGRDSRGEHNDQRNGNADGTHDEDTADSCARFFNLAVNDLQTPIVLSAGNCHMCKQIEKAGPLNGVTDLRKERRRAFACVKGFPNVA